MENNIQSPLEQPILPSTSWANLWLLSKWNVYLESERMSNLNIYDIINGDGEQSKSKTQNCFHLTIMFGALSFRLEC